MIDDKKYFTNSLLNWNRKYNKRQMPWKGEKDPYKIWLSEIILQQTRVEQGWNYYHQFVENFPTVIHLAKAPETKVFKLWEGLGYYSRCKNLIATAKIIASKHKGKFPEAYEDIISLKGVGSYTAAAIASFAFDLPFAVVDGNVFRVLSRFFGIATAIDSTAGKKMFTQLAAELLDKKHPGIYNQALMDFGAVVCKPKLPLCNTCPLKSRCMAYLNDRVNELPVKEKSISKKERWFYYLIAVFNGKVYVRKREAGDIWENLYEFVLIENKNAIREKKLKQLIPFDTIIDINNVESSAVSRKYRQLLTHQTIHGQFIRVNLTQPLKLKGYEAISFQKFKTLPFPKFITAYLAENQI